MNDLSKEMFFDLIRWVLFEKRLSCVFIGMQLLAPLGRNHKTYFRSKLWFNTEKIIFLSTSALEMLFKENSLHPKVAVNPEKHLFLTWSCKPDKHYTSLSKLNIQRFAPFFCFERKFLQTRNNILAVLRLKIRLSNEMLFAQSFRQFPKKWLSSRLEIRILALCVNHS